MSDTKSKKSTKAATTLVKLGEEGVEWPSFDDIKGYKQEVVRLKSVAAAINLICEGKTKVGQFPKGIMLSGDPGMGKTTMAKAMVAETSLPCIVIPDDANAGDIALAYAEAGNQAPCFLFIDDIDRIVSIETAQGFESDQSRVSLKTVIGCLDGLSSSAGVITLMTTNDYWGLPEPLRRSGRTDVHIPLAAPSDEDREEILRFYMDKYDGFFPDIAKSVAKKTRTLSCAALRSLVNDVWMQTVSKNPKKKPDLATITAVFQKRAMELVSGGGMLRQDTMSEEDRKRLCYHEAGHAVVIYALEKKCSDICILQSANTDSLGWTMERQDDFTETKATLQGLRDKIAEAFGGIAAEKIVLGEYDTGGSSDIQHAAQYISLMFASGLLGLQYIPNPTMTAHETAYSGGIFAANAETEDYKHYRSWVKDREFSEAFGKASDILSSEPGSLVLKELAEALLETGIVSAEAMEKIVKKHYRDSSEKGGE